MHLPYKANKQNFFESYGAIYFNVPRSDSD